jgi:osmoprotectant transport system ATP-binding protein
LPTTAIELREVSKRFDGSAHFAVKNISLKINDGDIVTVLGSSGSGKTTLLKLINRLYDLTAGEIYHYGDPVGKLKVNEYRRKIGYVIQQVGLFPHKTVEENIATVPKLIGWKNDEIKLRVEELLKLVKLDPEEYAKRYPKKLSGGEQQRVGLARALAANPSLLLMDEPFGAIDAITRNELQNELLRIRKATNATIIFITHDVQEAFKLGQKVVIMHNGEVCQYGTPIEVMRNPADEFVAQLIKSGDVLEKLKVLPVSSIIRKDGFERFESRKLFIIDSLSEALRFFVANDTKQVNVMGEDGVHAGVVRLEDIKGLIGQPNDVAKPYAERTKKHMGG